MKPCGNPDCHINRECKMVVLERDESGKPTVWCDPCIADMVKALNDAGFHTVASCCGHGFRPPTIALRDGRWLVIASDSDERKRIDSLFPRDINGNDMGLEGGDE